MKILTKPVSILLSLILILSVFTVVPFEAAEQEAVEYIYRWWDAETRQVRSANAVCTSFREIDDRSGSTLETYKPNVVRQDVTVSDRVMVPGDATLILCDGATLTLKRGMDVPEGVTLTIYGQTNDTGRIYTDFNRDKLPSMYKDYAIIGAGILGSNCGSITIHGGTLDLHSDGWAKGAVIGGANGGSPDVITVYGGNVTAEQCGAAALIGGGCGAPVSRHNGEGIRIYGGTVTAENARSGDAAAIGSGSDYSGSEGSIAIYGGTVTANGAGLAAGIGGGKASSNGPIDIYGGYITASGLYSYLTGAGIGSGGNADQRAPIRIHGGTIISTSQTGAGIGAGCNGSAGVIEISSATVVTSSTAGGAGIGGGKRRDGRGGFGGDITISSGSEVFATSSSYGKAQDFVDRVNSYTTFSGMKTDQIAYADSVVNIVAFLVDLFDCDISGCGIGGGYRSSAGTITISDSTVTAVSGAYAAAIGTGDEASSGCTINITDGSVVTATAEAEAAGIGTGNENDDPCVINITDSTVTANGGEYGAGVGGGDAGDAGDITITSSTVTAYGGKDAAGIGGGEGGSGGSIEIRSSSVRAYGAGNASGIGNGEDGYYSYVGVYGASDVIAWGGSAGGNAVCIADNGLLYDYSVSSYFDKGLKVAAGSDSNSALSYYKNDRYKAARHNRYARIYPCEHANTYWVSFGQHSHRKYCTDCETQPAEVRAHEWNSDNVCSVCGASRTMSALILREQSDSGAVDTEALTQYLDSYCVIPECTNIPDGKQFACWYNQPRDSIYFPGDVYRLDNTQEYLTAIYFDVTEAAYIDESGREQTVQAGVIDSSQPYLFLTPGWYVVGESMDTDKIITLWGDVSLILADGKTLRSSVSGRYGIRERIQPYEDAAGYYRVESSLTLYGQRQQTGAIDLGSKVMSMTGYSQYGANVTGADSGSEYYYSTFRNCAIRGGSFSLDGKLSVSEGCDISGGVVRIGDLSAGDTKLGWSSLSDTISIAELSSGSPAVSVADGQSLTDGASIYTGALSDAGIQSLRGKTLTPYLPHDYGDPQWVWSHEYRDATAIFRCADCDDSRQIEAEVSCEDSGKDRISTASCFFNGRVYSTTRTNRLIFDITIADAADGSVTADQQTSRAGKRIGLTAIPDEGYVLSSLSVADSGGREVEVSGFSFIMPESDVTVSAVFSSYEYFERAEPYIDSSGAYIVGCVEHYSADGRSYAAAPDGGIGEELDSTELSYFDFTLLADDTYRIDSYTGPTLDLSELVIPKTYLGKAVTVLGGSSRDTLIDYGGEAKTQFSLVLNENIREITDYSFYTMWVTEVAGDTSSLSTIGDYAFSWANSPGGYTLDVTLDYPGTISVGKETFNNMTVTARIRHSASFSRSDLHMNGLTYVFTDSHILSPGDPVWSWADDLSSASAAYTCADSRCAHGETVEASVTRETGEGVIVCTASADINGATYTDIKDILTDGIGARMYGHSISLEGDIGVNFYMELSDSVIAHRDTAFMRFTVPSGSSSEIRDVPVSAARTVSDGRRTYYVFKCYVAAKEMTSPIGARIIDGELAGAEYTYSVREYADYLLAHSGEREDLARAVPLVKAMLNYGAYSQLYFDKAPDDLANSGLAESEKLLGDVSIDIADPAVSSLPDGVTFEGATLSLRSETTLSLYFTADAEPIFSCGDYTVENAVVGGYRVARIRGVKAKHIGDIFTLTVNGSGTVSYSPLNYCLSVISDDTQDAKLQNAVKALYRYWQAADSYF